MSTLAAAIHSGNFVITAELNPPKGTNLTALFEKVDVLKRCVTACNLTDSHTARMTMSPLAVAHLLIDRGIDPILQVTGRDRNRIALQSDLLGAAALGVTNIVCMSGDDPQSGDHPQAKPVFDLDAIMLLHAISSLQAGCDLSGNQLDGVPRFYPGAVVNPGASDLTKELQRMEDKVQAGARFFQTQAVYDPRIFETFMNVAQKYNAPILAGVLLLKSAAMARHLNNQVPGISVSDALIQELAASQDRETKSVEISSRIMKQIKPMCQGVHLMMLGWETRIPQLLQAAEIA